MVGTIVLKMGLLQGLQFLQEGRVFWPAIRIEAKQRMLQVLPFGLQQNTSAWIGLGLGMGLDLEGL